MRSSEEVLAYVDEQIWYTQQLAKDRGIKLPLLSKVDLSPSQDSLEALHKQFYYLKLFIKGEI